jgi:hypothetical protein
MGLVGRASRGLYVGSVNVGPDPLRRSLRSPGRLFLWVLVVQLCSAAHAPGAEGRDRKVVPLPYAADRLQPGSCLVDEGIRTALQATAGHIESPDLSWFPGDVYEQRLASFLCQKWAELMRLPSGSLARYQETPLRGGYRWH